MKQINLAIIGASGVVGRTFLEVLEKKDLPIKNFYLFASARSAGTKITFKGKEYEVEELTENSFDRGIDIALFSAGSGPSKQYAPIAASKGCIVVDNSSAWRMDKDVPLVVPEVNPEDISLSKGIIANPNCVAIPSTVALKPLQAKYGIKRIIYSTYQAVTGAGIGGLTDLETTTKGGAPKRFAHPIYNNCLPHIDSFADDDYTYEELKIIAETRKILHDDSLRITATAVRVPVVNSHSVSINVELNNPFEMAELIETIRQGNGIVLQNDHMNNEYPLAANATGHDDVFVGRIRRDTSVENGVNLWVVADNVRKGAAVNAVQIAELLIQRLDVQTSDCSPMQPRG